MTTSSPIGPYLASAAGGAFLWIATSVISGRNEAWDSPLYFPVAYPLAIVLAGALGYFFPHKAWRWGLTVMLVQAVVLAFTARSFGLMPLGLIIFAVLALPAIVAAKVMAAIRRRAEAG